MRKDRKKHVFGRLLTTFVAVLFIAVTLADFIKYPEGSLAQAILEGLNRGVFRQYLGFFSASPLEKFGLLPACALFVVFAVNSWFNSKAIAWICEFVAFASSYVLLGHFMGPEGWHWMSLMPSSAYIWASLAFVVSVFVLVLCKVLRARKRILDKQAAAAAKPAKKSMPDDFESTRPVVAAPQPEEKLPDEMDTRAAIEQLLKATETPEFEEFPNYNPEDRILTETSDMTSSVSLDIFSAVEGETERRQEAERQRKEVFGVSTLRQRLEEDNIFEDKYSFSAPLTQVEPAFNSEPQVPVQTVQPAAPVAQPQAPQVVYVQQPQAPQPIIINLNGQTLTASTASSVQAPAQDPVSEPMPEPAPEPVPVPEPVPEPQPVEEEPVVEEPVVEEQVEPQPEPEPEPVPEPAPAPRPQPQVQPQVQPQAQPKAAKKPQGDIDMVSGVGGVSSSYSGDSYLLDRQKFNWEFPPVSLLKHYEPSVTLDDDISNDPNGQIIVETLKEFRVNVTLTNISRGPTFTLYELQLASGVRVSSVSNCASELNMHLAPKKGGVRILAPIPGKSAVGIEVPNIKRDTIGFDEMIPAIRSKYYKIPMALGKTITGDSVVIDLASTPHLLVAGTTGSGKSVCVNALICSVLYSKTPKEVRMILVDPKMVEMSIYNDIPHLLTPVITEGKRVIKALSFLVEEMERRMKMFSSIGVRKIEDYNEKIKQQNLCRVKLPYIMLIIDEFADLMISNIGKEMELLIKRLAALARFTGIHIVLATQRPTVDVISGTIKANIPTQIAFAVRSSTDSRTILDETGAENLLGKGDMLYKSQSERSPARIQGCFLDPEVESIVEFVKSQGKPDYIDEAFFEDDDDDNEDEGGDDEGPSGSESLLDRAWKIVSDRGEASTSYVQRKLSIGYNRAANLIEEMEDAGYIGPARGSKPREIIKYYGTDTVKANDEVQ